MSKDELIPIGRITGAHGIRGEVKLAPYGPLESVQWETVYIALKGKAAEPRKVLKHRVHKGVYLVFLEGVPDRNTAETLAGCEVSVERSGLPDTAEDEYYYAELVGMEVFTEEGKYVGKVENVFATGGNDVLETYGPHGEVLIPAIESVIVLVEPEKNRITVRLMEGLLPE
ncbi:Ribosome maturation factor RimM [Planctomycetaceae bacterium]|nr:Ribosome maturation factor RimM [Planctomycetaceae bacterium]